MLGAKIRFLKLVISGKLKVSKRPVQDVEADLEKLSFAKVAGSYDYLLGQKIWNLTETYLAKLEAQYEEQSAALAAYEELSVDRIWAKDIYALKF